MAEGISQLSSQFTQFTQNMSSNQALQASTMVGRDVLVPSNKTLLSRAELRPAPLRLSNPAMGRRSPSRIKWVRWLMSLTSAICRKGFMTLAGMALTQQANLPEGVYSMTAQSMDGG